jgi:hypothetical protein
MARGESVAVVGEELPSFSKRRVRIGRISAARPDARSIYYNGLTHVRTGVYGFRSNEILNSVSDYRSMRLFCETACEDSCKHGHDGIAFQGVPGFGVLECTQKD